jgi:hypothetical protein
MSDPLSPALISVAMVISESKELRRWFLALEKASISARMQEFQDLAMNLAAAGEPPELVQAARSLVQPSIYRAVLAVVNER